MKQYIGVILILVGVVLQLYTYFSGQVESANTFLGIGLLLALVGYLAHIFLNKKA